MKASQPAPERRFGAENSKSREALLEAAEQVMREEGYAAVTSRRIAERAGLKSQLVHYYFRSMDDLFLALLQRLSDTYLIQFARALASDKPLRALWEISSDSEAAVLTTEFLALANHRKAIGAEFIKLGLICSLEAKNHATSVCHRSLASPQMGVRKMDLL